MAPIGYSRMNCNSTYWLLHAYLVSGNGDGKGNRKELPVVNIVSRHLTSAL
jgi:hypothetical protein